MRSYLSSLTAALLAMHTVFGCCWHHAHASTPQGKSLPSVESSESHGVAHADDGCERSTGGCGHHGNHNCHGSKCVFTSSAKTGSPQFSLRLSPQSVVAPASTVPNVTRVQKPAFSPDELLPPLRLHLIERVLLI
jgi:hypothetical protein